MNETQFYRYLLEQAFEKGMLTGSDILRATGIGSKTLYNIRYGKSKKPHNGTLAKLAKGLDIPLMELRDKAVQLGEKLVNDELL